MTSVRGTLGSSTAVARPCILIPTGADTRALPHVIRAAISLAIPCTGVLCAAWTNPSHLWNVGPMTRRSTLVRARIL
jgi:hypothetical protein